LKTQFGARAEVFIQKSEINNQQSTIGNLKIGNRKSDIGIQRNPAVRERVSPARR
jgi:hypothetical protein